MKPITLLIALLLAPCLARAAPPVDISRLADVVCALESRGEAFPEWAVSPRGAVGLCQLLPATAQRMWASARLRGKYHPSLLFNPDISKRLARAYLIHCRGYGWSNIYELAFCYHNGHKAQRRTRGSGHDYAMLVRAEYEHAMLARR